MATIEAIDRLAVALGMHYSELIAGDVMSAQTLSIDTFDTPPQTEVLCSSCGKRPPVEGFLMCAPCRIAAGLPVSAEARAEADRALAKEAADRKAAHERFNAKKTAPAAEKGTTVTTKTTRKRHEMQTCECGYEVDWAPAFSKHQKGCAKHQAVAEAASIMEQAEKLEVPITPDEAAEIEQDYGLVLEPVYVADPPGCDEPCDEAAPGCTCDENPVDLEERIDPHIPEPIDAEVEREIDLIVSRDLVRALRKAWEITNAVRAERDLLAERVVDIETAPRFRRIPAPYTVFEDRSEHIEAVKAWAAEKAPEAALHRRFIREVEELAKSYGLEATITL